MAVRDRFDSATYRDILGWLGERPFTTFVAAANAGDEPFCLLRHDVDLSLTAALEMARVEADVGARATYFLLLGSAHYNLLAPENASVPAQLVALGHDVGLHYDTGAAGGLHADAATEFFALQAELLGKLSGTPVTAVARHNPGLGGDDPMATCTAFVNAYDPRFTREIVYISDSCGGWRDATVAILAAPQPPRRLQLLVHPVFWTGPSGDRWARLEAVRDAEQRAAAERAAATRQMWLGHPGLTEHDRRHGARGDAQSPSG